MLYLKKYVFMALAMLIFPMVCVVRVNSNGLLQEKNEIVKGITLGRSLFFSGHGTIIYEYTLKDTTDVNYNNQRLKELQQAGMIKRIYHYKKEITVSFDCGKSRYEAKLLEGDLPEYSSILVKNNGEARELICNMVNGLMSLKGRIYSYDPQKNFYSQNVENVLKSMYSFGPYPLELCLQGNLPELSYLSVSKITEEVFNNIQCKRLHITEVVNPDNYCNLWVSPLHNFAVLKSEVFSDNKYNVEIMDYEKTNGIWFIKKYSWSSYNITDGHSHLLSTTTATFSNDWNLNVVIPQKLFELDFPDGMKVYDRR